MEHDRTMTAPARPGHAPSLRSGWILQIIGVLVLFGSFYLDSYSTTSYYPLAGRVVTDSPYLVEGLVIGALGLVCLVAGRMLERRRKAQRLTQLKSHE